MVYVFDAYGTLVELDDFYGRMQRALAERGWDFPADAVQTAARREMRHYMAHAVRARCAESYAAVRTECAVILRDALAELSGRSPSLDAVEHALIEAIHFRPFSEVREVLQKLHARGVELAVASNWDYALPQHLQSLDLAHYFRFIQTSASVGAAKPAAAFFHAIQQAVRERFAGLNSSQILYIGDHFQNDVLAARAAGFQTRWLVRDQRDIASGDASHVDEEHIDSLRALL